MTDVRVDAPEVEEGRDDYASRRLGVAGLASDAVVYGGTRALLKSLSFLLVPLYAHFVAPAEFGRLELVLATVAIVDVLITAGMDGVFARFYFDRDARLWRRQIISLYLVIESVYPAFVVFPLVLLSAQLSDGIFGTAEYAGFFVIALVDVYLTNIVDLPMTLTRLRRRRRRFVAYSLTRGLTQIVLTVLLVAVWHLNVKGILIASLASVGVAFVVTLREYVPDLTRRIDWRVGRRDGLLRVARDHRRPRLLCPRPARPLLRQALPRPRGCRSLRRRVPLQPGGSRCRARVPDGLGAVALPVAAQRAPSADGRARHALLLPRDRFPGRPRLGVDAARLPPAHARALLGCRARDRAARARRGRDGRLHDFPRGLQRQEAHAARPAARGLRLRGSRVGLYFLLIPPFSFVGAAWATAAAFTCLSLLVLAVSNRIYPVPWDWRRMGLAVGLTVAGALLSLGVDAWLSVPVSIPVRLAITAAYPLLLYALGFFPPGDLAAARSRLRKRRSTAEGPGER